MKSTQDVSRGFGANATGAAPYLTRTNDSSLRSRYAKSRSWYQRAIQVIPGGTHLSGIPLVDVDTTPMYFQRSKGCRIWDVDGNEYVDYLMAFGAVFLGYAQEEVELAAARQAQDVRLVSMNHPLHVKFIETLLRRFPGTEMGSFFKTGSEATTAALRVARRCTGRSRVARSGYHGWHDWCLPLADFVPAGMSAQVREYSPNDPDSLGRLLAESGEPFAAVILAPEMVLPHRPEVFRELQRLAHAHGAVFIMDEVKTGLRIAPGSVSERVGLVPDLITVSKALGNGFPVAALLGRRKVMQVAAGMHYSATFHGDAPAMAAALAVLQIAEATQAQEHVFRLGKRLIDGLNEVCRQEGMPAEAYAEPLAPMPFFHFIHPDADVNAKLVRAFYREVLARGVLLHPRHMWFLSAAHTVADVDFTIAVAREGLRVARLELPIPLT
jgi:glutamate-1-semialdehyde aminotransferase